MGILAADFEESFGSNQMGSICPEAFIEWIQYTVENCPEEIRDEMSNQILQAFFKSDAIIFPEMFGTAVAGIIYRLGHMLSFMQSGMFIERKYISLRKEPDSFMRPVKNSNSWQHWFLHVELNTEEICRLHITTDPLPNYDINERCSIPNPYYQES